MLRLENARHALHGGYPCLELEVQGRPVRLIAEAKPTVVAAGLVHLGDEFADVCPVATVHPDGGPPQQLEGFSSDPRLFALWRQFAQAEDFAEGPVPIPAHA